MPSPAEQEATALPILIRPATPDDLPAINEIYNYYVINSTASYQLEPEPLDSRHAWFAQRSAAYPVTVAQVDGQVVGWGALSPFHRRPAYAHTVENSLYVAAGRHRCGIGAALLADLIRRAALLDHHTIVALIDADQTASVALHLKFGFDKVGHLRQVGHKFGRWLDVIYMQLLLTHEPR